MHKGEAEKKTTPEGMKDIEVLEDEMKKKFDETEKTIEAGAPPEATAEDLAQEEKETKTTEPTSDIESVNVSTLTSKKEHTMQQ